VWCTVIDDRQSRTDIERDWEDNSDSGSACEWGVGPTTAGRAATRAGCCMTSTQVQTEEVQATSNNTRVGEQRSAAAAVRDAGPQRSERSERRVSVNRRGMRMDRDSDRQRSTMRWTMDRVIDREREWRSLQGGQLQAKLWITEKRTSPPASHGELFYMLSAAESGHSDQNSFTISSPVPLRPQKESNNQIQNSLPK